jgi:hypothetical protein
MPAARGGGMRWKGFGGGALSGCAEAFRMGGYGKETKAAW